MEKKTRRQPKKKPKRKVKRKAVRKRIVRKRLAQKRGFLKMKISEITSKVLSADGDGEICFAIKALVKNDSDDTDISLRQRHNLDSVHE